MKLSLCLAVYNEEKFLHYALDSAAEWCDEIIIVDGGSDDATVKIAKSYGKKVRVIETDNPIIFHKNKQKAIEAATGDWILQLDADEAVSKELKDEILKRVQDDNGPVAFWIPRKNYFLGKFLTKGGVYPDKTIRLYKNGVAHFPCKTVHENVEINGPVGSLKNDLLHYADPDFDRYLVRWNRYTTLDAELMAKNGEKAGFFSYFIAKPLTTFFLMYFRHKGILDGYPGFVFALFSAIRHWVIYIKLRAKRTA
ncbi:glycosyltransferase family 2 protein [Candidatus Microgenomates bacterium]|nr:glycosyltransferase family 2 protein [Candidatus Microgenomates bacterium]